MIKKAKISSTPPTSLDMDPSGTPTNCDSTTCESPSKSDGSIAPIDEVQSKLHVKNNHGWRKVVLNFTPSWFSVNMGTGIVSILLHNLPYNGVWLYWISVAIFCLNILLFMTFLSISILRYLMYRGLFMFMIHHPVQSLFTGTFPMGLATIVNMVVFVCVPAFGPWAIIFAWALWWVDVIFSVATCFYLPFVIMYKHDNELSKMTAVWLLPIVSTIVASASGGIVANVLPNPQHALWTVIVSYVLWGTGFPLAMVVLVIYFQRLTLHHLPAREVIVSVFLPLGPLGQGSYAIMQLGKVAKDVFPITGTLDPSAGSTFYNLGHALALVIWGYGLIWLFFAIASITRHRFPFNMGWWGFTFPLGVYTVSTTMLAKDLPSLFFKILGTIFSLVVVLLWAIVSIKTTHRALKGQLFFAPCVAKYEAERAMNDLAKQRSQSSV